MAGPAGDLAALGDLYTRGLLDDEEFRRAKSLVLGAGRGLQEVEIPSWAEHWVVDLTAFFCYFFFVRYSFH